MNNPIAIQKIRQLQEQEGHRPCYRTDRVICPYIESCCWAEGCMNKVFIRPLFKFNVVEEKEEKDGS